jgi:hypothetical protein
MLRKTHTERERERERESAVQNIPHLAGENVE